MEQPQASELLRTSFGQKQLALNAEDKVAHMCMHGLRDSENKLPHYKPTTIRATKGIVTDRTARRCNHEHEHQQLQGCTSTGQLRTALAQEYTTEFCNRLAADFKGYLKHNNSAYPTRVREYDDELDVVEIADEDPYEEPPHFEDEDDTDIERAARVERLIEEAKARRLANPAPTTPTPTKFPPKLTPTAKRAPTKTNTSADQFEDMPTPPGLLPPGERASSSTDAPQRVLVDTLAVPDATAKRKQTDETSSKHLEQLIIQHQRYAPGNAFVISAGQRLAVVQELFGTPHGKTVMVAVLSRQPTEPASPEPMASRHIANLSCVLRKESDDSSWTFEPWGTYDNKVTKFKKRPAWMFSVFGHIRQGDDLSDSLAASPLEAVEEQADREVVTTRSLPVV
jgi:hypothetical protein